MYCIIISCSSFISFSIYFVAVYLLFEINFLTKEKGVTLQENILKEAPRLNKKWSLAT